MPDALIDSLADDLAPVAPLRVRTGLAWVLLAAIATALLVLVMDGFWHGVLTGEASVPYFLANGMLGILGGSSAFAVVRMASPQVGNSQEGARWSAAMLALLPLTALLMLGVNGRPHRVDAKDRVALVHGDLNDHGSLARAVDAVRPDYVFHLAAQSYPQTSFTAPIETLQRAVHIHPTVSELLPTIAIELKPLA